MLRSWRTLLPAGLLAIAVLLTGCNVGAPYVSAADGSLWTPQPFPEAHDDRGLIPLGPHDVQMTVNSPERLTEVTGYINLSEGGGCSLHLVAEERPVEGGQADLLEVVKIDKGPAYASLNERGWGDTRDPATASLVGMTLAHPLGEVVNGDHRYQSLCVIHALPAMLVADDDNGILRWDESALGKFADAAYESFVAVVLQETLASQEEYSRLARTVSEVGSRPELLFAIHATPLRVRKSPSGTVVLSFSVQKKQEHSVTIVLTPSQARKLEYPKKSESFEAYLAKYRDSQGRVRSVLEQYFTVR